MAYIGGDILEATCLHPTLGTFRFEAKANEAFTLDKGGIRNDDSADGITGAGTMIVKKTNTRWSLEGPVAVDMLGDIEMSGLNDLAASTDPGVWTLTSISGAIYKGTGIPVGDLNIDTNTSQLKLKVAGGGKLEQIA
jgi:hypothetical protein